MKRTISFIALIFLATFCKREAPTSDASKLRVTAFEPAVLQETPGKKGKVLANLKPGETLTDLDETSDFLTPVVAGDSTFQSPWLKAKNAQGQIGWVYAAAVAPVEADYATWFRGKRTDSFFGKNLARRLTGWANAMQNAQSDEDFAENFREGLWLRDTLVRILARRSEPNEADFQPDFFWLNDALPGFLVQLVAEGTQPYLFADYRFFQKIALQTPEPQDDVFMAACLAAFPNDSIESFFPAWTIQTDDLSGSSQLGSGQHLRMLRAIERGLRAGHFFEPELLALKDRLLDDILNKNSSFWQPKELLTHELDEILSLKLNCLTERDRLALTERLRILREAEANGVQVNLRAG